MNTNAQLNIERQQIAQAKRNNEALFTLLVQEKNERIAAREEAERKRAQQEADRRAIRAENAFRIIFIVAVSVASWAVLYGLTMIGMPNTMAMIAWVCVAIAAGIRIGVLVERIGRG